MNQTSFLNRLTSRDLRDLGTAERLLELGSFLAKPIPGGRCSLRFHSERDAEVIKRTLVEDPGVGTAAPRGVALLEDALAENVLVRAGARVATMTPDDGEQSLPTSDPLKVGGWGTSPDVSPVTELALAQRRRVSAVLPVSRRWAVGGGVVAAAWTFNQLMSAISAAIVRAAFVGSGEDGEPLGLLMDESVSVFASLAEAEAAVVDVGHEPTALFCSTSLRTTLRAAGGAATAGEIAAPLPPIYASHHIPAETAVGVLGDWRQMAIVSWGSLDLLVNPFSLDSSGTIRLTASMTCDVLPLRLEGFAVLDPTHTPE